MVARKKYTINDAHALAQARGGICLSITMNKVHDVLKWRCGNAHPWDAKFYKIQQGSWCRICAGLVVTIEDCHKLAESKGGKFLSSEYKGNKYKHEWECGKGHVFLKSYNKITSHGQWCPTCSDTRKTIEDCQKVAEIRGGRCLSTEYKNATSDLWWQCKQGHKWEATWANVSQGSWCSKCADKTRGERLVRYVFEKIFGCEFEKSYPNWLINPKTGKNLELDGYNEKLHIAFEHQGRHHEKSVAKSYMRYHPEQSYLDEFKEKKCKEHGITLIEVPEIGRRLKEKDLVPYILSEFDKYNIAYPEIAKNFTINEKEFYDAYMPKPSDNYNPIHQFDLKDNFIQEWHNPSHAVYNLRNQRSNGIYQALNGEIKTAYGYKWKYAHEQPCN